MIGRDELLSLCGDVESARVERTQATKDTEKFSRAVCAFANDVPDSRRPGYLVVGLDDRGRPTGLKVTDELLKDLASLRSNGNILPIPAINVERFVLDGGEVGVVEVLPSDMPPVRYRGQIWVRVGPTKAVASEAEERILSEKRTARARSWDTCSVGEAKLGDLSQRLFAEYRAQVVAAEVIDANNRSVEEQLASLRFFDLGNGCPTVAGILVFGINPRYYLPGAYVQYVRFAGSQITDEPIDQMEIDGTVSSMAELAKDKFLANNRSAMHHQGGFREGVVDQYPEWAIREFLHNALIHRDYQSNAPVRFYWFEDRIEIASPGGLYGRVTLDTITSVNDYRNPVLAEAMKALGYVNRFGYGIQRAQFLLQRNGNPLAEIRADQNTVLVTIRVRNQ